MKQIVFFIAIIGSVAVVGAAGFFLFRGGDDGRGDSVAVANFAECEAAGYAVMESFPRQCRAPSGQLFVEDIGNELEKIDLIRVATPRPNEAITSPLTIEGEARGYWFFEASFPIRLLDDAGRQIATVISQSQGEWMTQDFVPFEAVLEFEAPASSIGTLVFERNNPSGLRQHEDELVMPIRFQAATQSRARDGCVITGCSSQVCEDEEIITTCEFRPEYACYNAAICERQINGQCGWTMSSSLQQCLRSVGG